MPEFVYYYRLEGRMVGSSQCIGVVNTSTTVFFGIDDDDNMLVRNYLITRCVLTLHYW